MAERFLGRAAVSGQYLHVNSANDSTVGGTGDLLVFTCQDFASPVTIDRLTFEITAAGGATSVSRIGVWADDGTRNRPGALIHDSGGLATSGATGLIEDTVALTIGPGRVWFGIVPQVDAADPTFVSTIDNECPIGMPGTITALNQFFVTQSGVTGALPDPPVPNGTSGVAIACAVRVA